ncbi:MAG: aminotransferase class I/II-fold pyridoxal phosphate-dependent enzyme [Myxococcales bacterium]|nr:aminotransferase class I/II-fold pyridoxal phosphate-dependent enzyme [Myxococcales bacterium]
MRPEIRPAIRTENIRYAVRDIVVLAQEVARSGIPMLYLNIGDPNLYDFQTPAPIVEATYRAMLDNRNGYAPSSGLQTARDAIAKEAETNGIVNIHDIFVTTGASEGIDICLSALVDAGENVLLPTPGYPLYSAILHKLGAQENPYYLDESNGWQPNLADIASKIDAKTRAIVLINPNNPTGSVCSRETLGGVIELAKAHDLVIFADEIYDKLLFDRGHHTSLASLDADVPVITFNGLSKSYLAPGFRIGWGIVSGDRRRLASYIEAINKLLRARLSANHPEQFAIATALLGDHSHLEPAIEKLQRRRDITVEMLNAIDGISCVAPKGAFYAFPKLEVEGSDDEFVKGLLRETGVVVVPGSGFGQLPGTKHFRVVFLPPEQVLREAYQKIGEFMSRYR